jgi:hypothetical protein
MGHAATPWRVDGSLRRVQGLGLLPVVGHGIAGFMVNLGSDHRPSRNVSGSAVSDRDIAIRPSAIISKKLEGSFQKTAE